MLEENLPSVSGGDSTLAQAVAGARRLFEEPTKAPTPEPTRPETHEAQETNVRPQDVAEPTTSNDVDDDFSAVFAAPKEERGADDVHYADDDSLPTTLEDLAAQLKTTPEKLLERLEANTKVNGVENKVKLKELVKSYQLDKYNNQKSQELSEKQKLVTQVQQAYEQKERELSDAINYSRAIVEQADGLFENEFANVNWEQLRNEDPLEFNLKRIDYQDKKTKIDNLKLQVMQQVEYEKQKLQYEQQQNNEVQQQQKQEVLKRESELLLKVLPGLKEPKVREAFTREVKEYAVKYGISEGELAQITDHRVLAVMADGIAYRKLLASKKDVSQRTKDVPAYVPPKARNIPASSGRQDEEVRVLKESAAKGSVAAGAALLTRLGII